MCVCVCFCECECGLVSGQQVTKLEGVYWNDSVCPSVHVSGFVQKIIYPLNCSIFYNRTCMVVHHHGVEYYGGKIVCSLQGQGHSEGLCNQNVTVSMSSQLMVLL